MLELEPVAVCNYSYMSSAFITGVSARLIWRVSFGQWRVRSRGSPYVERSTGESCSDTLSYQIDNPTVNHDINRNIVSRFIINGLNVEQICKDWRQTSLY